MHHGSRIDAVTVYPDGATVTRVVRVDVPAGDSTLIIADFPPGLDTTSLRIDGETSSPLIIGAIDVRPPKAVPPIDLPVLEKRVESVRDQRSVLDDRIAAETARKRFAERFVNEVPFGLGEKGDARPLVEWRQAFVAVPEDIATADNAIRELKLALRDVDREIARLEAQLRADPPRKLEVRIDLTAQAKVSGILRVSYTMRDARWVPIYDARLDTGQYNREPSLELVRRAEIVQQTDEDWTDVTLSVSTVRTAKGGSAPELEPMMVRLQAPETPVMAMRRATERARQGTALPIPAAPSGGAAAPAIAAAVSVPPPVPIQEREARIETGSFQAVFRVPGRVSVANKEGAKSVRIGATTLAPDLLARSAPVLDPTAFLEASFKHTEDVPILPGKVSLFRNGMFVGQGTLALAGKDEIVNVGFGADDQIKVTRVLQHKTQRSSGLIAASKVDEREFRITVRNGHDWPIKVVIEDRQPVSETEDVQVELMAVTTKPTQTNVRDKRGVLSWRLDVRGRETREIAFGWRVWWPAAKSVTFDEPRT
jgi:uncharacterized protein (TIGR02231 family)